MLNPELRKLIASGLNKYASPDEPSGIIPFEPIEVHPNIMRGALVYEIAEVISDAVNGPAIHAYELADMIVDTVEERLGLKA